MEEQIKMTNDEILSITVVNSWKLVIDRFDKVLEDFTDDPLGQPVAPDKNRLFYLLGHLTAVHDRMLPMLGLGERFHPELEDAYIRNLERVLGDPLPATELRRAWSEVNDNLTAVFEQFTLLDELEKYAEAAPIPICRSSLREPPLWRMNETISI
jgi:hypothetical protein